jgi:hypothetical protein
MLNRQSHIDFFSSYGRPVVNVPAEWRPRDFCGPLPAKVLKRGSDFPLLVEFSLCL